MALKQGSKLDHLQGIKETIFDGPTSYDVYGPFLWEEDIFKKNGNIYVPAGRIMLPMSIEGRDPRDCDGKLATTFTIFNRDYFDGLSAPTPIGSDAPQTEEGYQCLSDWCENMPSRDIQGYSDCVSVQTWTNVNDPYGAVRRHVQYVMKNLDEISRLAENAKVSDLVKRVFIEY